MRNFYWLILILALSLTPALANDRSISSVGGRPVVADGEHPSVRMVEEWVQIDVYPSYYWTTAEFVFENSGPATFVKMGFPERDRAEGFLVFRTWVDGVPIQARRVEVGKDPERDSWLHHWVKEVHFEAGQRRLVRVMYRSTPGGANSGENYVVYDFTGSNWKGSIRSSELVINMHVPFLPGYTGRFPGFSQTGNRFRRRWVDWDKDESVHFYYYPDIEKFLAWGVLMENQSNLRPYRRLKEDDLAGKDDWTLLLMENEILARHGKPFDDPRLRKYFQSKQWYRADPDYRMPDQREVELIRRYRTRRKKKP